MEYVVGFMLAIAMLFMAGAYKVCKQDGQEGGFLLGVVTTTFLVSILFWLFELIVNH